jgi:hypothetical protein
MAPDLDAMILEYTSSTEALQAAEVPYKLLVYAALSY